MRLKWPSCFLLVFINHSFYSASIRQFGNYWSQVMGWDQGKTLIHIACRLTMCHVMNQKHIYTLRGLKYAMFLHRQYWARLRFSRNSNKVLAEVNLSQETGLASREYCRIVNPHFIQLYNLLSFNTRQQYLPLLCKSLLDKIGNIDRSIGPAIS